MYSLTKVMSPREILLEQIPVLAIAILIAELFYKFHSFTLECLAFLATWYALDAFISLFPFNRKDKNGRSDL
jgi:hypothetical protein